MIIHIFITCLEDGNLPFISNIYLMLYRESLCILIMIILIILEFLLVVKKKRKLRKKKMTMAGNLRQVNDKFFINKINCELILYFLGMLLRDKKKNRNM